MRKRDDFATDGRVRGLLEVLARIEAVELRGRSDSRSRACRGHATAGKHQPSQRQTRPLLSKVTSEALSVLPTSARARSARTCGWSGRTVCLTSPFVGPEGGGMTDAEANAPAEQTGFRVLGGVTKKLIRLNVETHPFPEP